MNEKKTVLRIQSVGILDQRYVKSLPTVYINLRCEVVLIFPFEKPVQHLCSVLIYVHLSIVLPCKKIKLKQIPYR